MYARFLLLIRFHSFFLLLLFMRACAFYVASFFYGREDSLFAVILLLEKRTPYFLFIFTSLLLTVDGFRRGHLPALSDRNAKMTEKYDTNDNARHVLFLYAMIMLITFYDQ